MDEHFALFLEEFGLPATTQEVPDESLEKYTGVLPACLMSYWRSYGWAAFHNGLIWLTNPDLYSDLVANWLSQVKSLRGSEYLVFARTAFGDLFAFRPSTGNIISVSIAGGWIMAPKKHDSPVKNRELCMQSFFATALPKDFDIQDEFDRPMFNSLVASLGTLQSDEIYRVDFDSDAHLKVPSKLFLPEYISSILNSEIPVLRCV